jgi:probable phosphoglycerate mutase
MPVSRPSPEEDTQLTSGLYLLFVDGAKRANPAGKTEAPGGVGVVLKDPKGRLVGGCEISHAIDPVPDPHTAEYQALLAGAQLALGRGVEYVAVFSDSRTMVNQVNNIWNRREHLEALCLRAQEALSRFKGVQVSWIPREWNKRADELAGRALAGG